jgi:hypothetical protein
MFNSLDNQMKAKAYWACRSCTACAQGMYHQLQEIEVKLDEVEKSCSKNEGDIRKAESEVEKLTEQVKKQAKLLEKTAASEDGSVNEEMRKREVCRLNMVMYRMGEAAGNRTGRGQWDWNIQSCLNLFAALKMDLAENSIKFCRRVREPSEAARQLVERGPGS